MLIEKAYKFRIYPTPEQAMLINKTMGCSRFVFNRFLALWNDTYKETGKGLTYNACSAFKKQNDAPKFKSKKNPVQSYQTNYTNGNIAVIDHNIKLPKLELVKFSKSREVEGRVINTTIRRNPSGK